MTNETQIHEIGIGTVFKRSPLVVPVWKLRNWFQQLEEKNASAEETVRCIKELMGDVDYQDVILEEPTKLKNL